MASEGDKDYGGAWSRVPTWDGSPQTWRAFHREMMWWTSSLDLESTKRYNLAARWLLRQSGIVKQRGEEFTPDELAYHREIKVTDPATGAEQITQHEDPLAGLNKLLRALEGINGRTLLDKRGELRNSFYLDLKRRPGERIAEFCTRFRTMLADLRAEGVTLPASETGWFFRNKLGLDPLRVQLLETALNGAEDYEQIEREVLRLFKELHTQDPLMRSRNLEQKGTPLLNRFLNQSSSSLSRNSSYAPSVTTSGHTARSFRSSSSAASSGRFQGPRRPFPPKQAMVSEVAEDEPKQEELTEEEEPHGPGLEEILQTEAEALAAELDSAAEHGLDDEMLMEIEDSVENAAEALLTMKEARSKLQEVKRDRGYGKTAEGQANKSSLKKTSGKHPCFDCGKVGHWAGDKECEKPGAGLGRKQMDRKSTKHVKVAETLEAEAVNQSQTGHDVLAVTCTCKPLSAPLVNALEESHSEPKEVNLASLSLTADKRLVGALDSACNRTCTGPEWLSGFLQGLRKAPYEIQQLVTSKPESETFRFGNGGTKISLRRWRLPTVVGGKLICFWVSLVDVPSLGLLLGRDFLEAVGADLSFSRRELKCDRLGTSAIALKQLAAGHYLLPLLPKTWPCLATQRWRRMGQDGIVELQSETVDWLKRCFRGQGGLKGSCHDHMLTEHSMHVGNLVCTVMANRPSMSSVQVNSMSSAPAVRSSPKTSSRTRTSSRSTRSADAKRAPRHDGVGKMAPLCAEATPARPVGRARGLPVAFTKALLAISALAIPCNLYRGEVAVPGTAAGRPKDTALQAHGLCPEGQALQHGQSGGVHSPSRAPWISSGVLRGSDFGWDAASPPCQGSGKQSQEGGARRGVSRSSEEEGQGGKRGRSPHLDWAQRRFAHTSSRLGEVGWTVARGRGCKGHHRNLEGESASNRQCAQREAKIFQAGDCSEVSPSAKSRSGKDTSDVFDCLVGDSRKSPNHHALGPSDYDAAGDRSFEGTAASREEALERGSSCQLGGDGREVRGERERHEREHKTGHSREHGRAQQRKAGGTVWGGRDGSDSRRCGESGGPMNFPGFNPFTINQNLKKGQAQMIAQAWMKHEAERLKTSWGPKKIRDVMVNEYEAEMRSYLTDEIFVQPISFVLDSNEAFVNDHVPESKHKRGPFVTEVYTSAENVMKEAKKRGHKVGASMSLESGWNFLRKRDQDKALQKISEEKPYCVVLAFPCNGFSPLQRLNSKYPERRAWRRSVGRRLMKFAIKVARLQLRAGRHVILENPRQSDAWNEPEMMKLWEEFDLYWANFDQCRFGLASEAD